MTKRQDTHRAKATEAQAVADAFRAKGNEAAALFHEKCARVHTEIATGKRA